MKKHILLIDSTYAKNSSTPSGKIMYKFGEHLASNYPVQVTVISSIKEQDFTSRIETIYIPTQLDFFSKKREKLIELLEVKKAFKRFIARVLLHIINHNLDSGAYKNIIDICQFKAWLNKEERGKYDAIVTIFAPYSNLKPSLLAKKKLRIKDFYPFIMEPWADHYSANHSNRKKRIAEEIKIFKSSKTIFCYEEYVSKSKYSRIKQFEEKTSMIPTNFLEKRIITPPINGNGKVHCVYAGMFYSKIREPSNLFTYFRLLPKNYILHLYIRGNNAWIKDLSLELGERCVIHEFISDPKVFSAEMQKASVFLSIGNSIENEIPSKMIEYISYCKPIIHFINNKRDPIPQRFGKYPAILFVDYNEASEKNASKIQQFVEKIVENKIDEREIFAQFKEYTIDYVVEKFYKSLLAK